MRRKDGRKEEEKEMDVQDGETMGSESVLWVQVHKKLDFQHTQTFKTLYTEFDSFLSSIQYIHTTRYSTYNQYKQYS